MTAEIAAAFLDFRQAVDPEPGGEEAEGCQNFGRSRLPEEREADLAGLEGRPEKEE